jgi:tetratricopeptide (TPR) repeat protein
MLEYAIFNLAQCLDANPRCFEAANLLASIYVQKNKKMRAIDYYHRSLGIDEGQAEVHFALGELYEFFIERDKALLHYRRCVEIDPGHVKGHSSLVRFYLARNDPASADRHTAIALRLGREMFGDRLVRGEEARKKGTHGVALDIYEGIIREAPILDEAYIGYYDVCRGIGDYAAAARILERLVFVRPDFKKTYLLLGDIYYNRKLPGPRKVRLERAIRNLQKAVALDPDNYEASLMLAEIFDSMGREAESAEWERRARESEDRSRR